MKLNQKGFSPLLVIGLVLAASLVGFGTWRILSKDKSELQQAPTVQETEKTPLAENNTPQQTALETNEVIELSPDQTVTIVTKQDIDKLPVKTPDTFKAYMSGAIEANPSDPKCDIAYVVSKISRVNVRGGIGPVDKGNTTGSVECGGGAAMIWYVDSGGKWNSLGFQDSPDCEQVKKFKIYSEFLEECYDTSADEVKPNPVGSIKQLKQ